MTNNNDSEFFTGLGTGLVIVLMIVIVGGVGAMLGTTVTQHGDIEYGRNQGITLCSEKPDECRIRYQNIKLDLKETQK